ncbi:MAG: hypothetical protein ACOC40_01935 [Thermoplasmatota archaeon]
MNRKYVGIIITIWIIAVLLIAMTYSFLPGFIREKGNLYNSTEYAQMYLNDDEYKNLEIEYDYVEDYGPDDGSRNQLLYIINKYCEKDEVKDRIDDKVKDEDRRNFYTEEDIYNLNDEYQDVTRHRDTMTIHILFLDGLWEKDKDVLGLSYGGNKIVVFKQAIIGISSKSNLEVLDIEKSVIVHEFGHLISLVGINYDSNHEVKNHHCSQEEGSCVMASSVEVNIGKFTQAPPTDFCSLCREDIEEIKNKEIGLGLEEYLTYITIISEVGIFVGISVSLTPEKKYYHRNPNNQPVRNNQYWNEKDSYTRNESSFNQHDGYDNKEYDEDRYY